MVVACFSRVCCLVASVAVSGGAEGNEQACLCCAVGP